MVLLTTSPARFTAARFRGTVDRVAGSGLAASSCLDEADGR
jgi:hypothetical protein